MTGEGPTQNVPPLRIRLAGRALNATVAHAPFLWPVIRAPIRAFFDRAADGWDDRVRPGSAEHLAALAAGTARIQEPPERILDIGSGTGEDALMLAREFPQARVRGIDISQEMVRQALAKTGLDPEGRIHFKVADASNLSYGKESFDLVAQLNMPVFFSEIARVLRPGGSVVIATSIGPRTPFFTPSSVLRRKFRRHGVEEVAEGGAVDGTYWIGGLKR